MALKTLKIIPTVKSQALNVGEPLLGPSVSSQPSQSEATNVRTITVRNAGASKKKKRLQRNFPVKKRCVPHVPHK